MDVSGEIIKVLDALCEKIGIAIDWQSKNVIPYLQELCDKYARYELVTSIFTIIVCLVLIIIAVMVFIKYKAYITETSDRFEMTRNLENIAWIFVIVFVFCIVCAIIIIFQAYAVIECIVIPEKVIFEYLKYHINF